MFQRQVRRRSSTSGIGRFWRGSWTKGRSRRSMAWWAGGHATSSFGFMRGSGWDLVRRLHGGFGISVSDDTVYRALRDLGFSHVSARPRAYKQDGEAIEAFKKTSEHAWRKSAAVLHRTRR